jgi:hypothetical protein
MKIYFATWLLERAQGDALTKVGANSRLMSYYHTRDKKHLLKGYTKTGKVPDENLSGGDGSRDGRRKSPANKA